MTLPITSPMTLLMNIPLSVLCHLYYCPANDIDNDLTKDLTAYINHV